MSESPAPYRVLARKYRPQRFSELIGQDAMVTTLGNAIRRERLAHAFLLTGVRGVGKTSTARLIAKALNCVGVDGQGGPTIDPCGVCDYCASIAEGRNPDVIEMDAASHTGVDDVRSIIDISRTTGFGARFQIFIIDEVHMLSKNAFNALLKTLEEPPEHVKFLLATTEVTKIPVTVLSRCQRFDLRRIPAEKLAAQFADICAKEGAEAEEEALALIARAAEGSSRDGLSMLDQAIAHGTGTVTATQVREMLGLSDRGAIRTLFARLLTGDAAGALAMLAEQHDLGVDPAAVLRGLLETVHGVTRRKIGGHADPAMSVEEREALADWASRLGFAALHRLWQLLLKGHGEVVTAVLPIEAAEMALLRVIHASTLPDPGELAKVVVSGQPIAAPAGAANRAPPAPGAPAAAQGSPPPAASAEPALPASYGELYRQLNESFWSSALLMHDHFGLIRYAAPTLTVKPNRLIKPDEMKQLEQSLRDLTGVRWVVDLADGPAEPTLRDQEAMERERERQAVLAMPVVQAAIEAFPDAELIGYSDAISRSQA